MSGTLFFPPTTHIPFRVGRPLPPPTPGWPDPAKLARAKGIEDGALYQGETCVATWGNPDGFRTSWASCGRTWNSMLWGAWLSERGLDWLDRPAIELPSGAAKQFNADVLVKHILSYTSGANPPGSRWMYSGGGDARGKHWPRQNAVLGELFGMAVDEACQRVLIDAIGGTLLASRSPDDGTLRVQGSSRAQTGLTRMMLDGGWVNDVQIIDPAFVARATAGGVNGDGQPFLYEGYETHLCKGGRAWELEMPGVPDLFMARDGSDSTTSGHGAIVGVPSLGATFAYRGATPEKVFPQVFI